jgi:2-dehydro-3-deoxygluconokinase
MKPASFASIGECMIELSAGKGDLWRMGFAGDTFNTAWYARATLPRNRRVAYVTALGDDPFSADMQKFFAKAGVETDRIREVPGRRPGLYAIMLKKAERAFTYWRGESAARSLADDAEWLANALSDVDVLYFSGITLAILAEPARKTLFAELARRRKEGARVAFDPNFRPALWPDKKVARSAIERGYRIADIALPTFSDEALLFGDRTVRETEQRMIKAGLCEYVIKLGDKPAVVFGDGLHGEVPPAKPRKIVDTTGAGDSFGGAYLAGRIIGLGPIDAAHLGHLVAAEVIGVHGALAKIDRKKVMRALKLKRKT